MNVNTNRPIPFGRLRDGERFRIYSERKLGKMIRSTDRTAYRKVGNSHSEHDGRDIILALNDLVIPLGRRS